MEPFKITCVTCTARLTVRNEAAIGQILACPKCGSMVQVTAPPKRAVDGAASAAAAAAVAPSLATPPAASISATHAPAVTTFDDVADFGVDLSIGGDLGRAAGPMAPPIVAAAPAKAAGGLSGAKLAALIGASAVLGSVLVVGALSLLRSDPDPAVVAPAPASAGAPPAAFVTPSEINNDIAAGTQSAPTADAGTESTPSVEPADPAVPGEEVAANVDARDPFAPSNPANDTPAPAETGNPDAGDLDAGAESEVADSDAAPADATPRLRIDPLEFDPEGLDMASLLRDGGDESAGVQDLAPPEPAALVESEAPADETNNAVPPADEVAAVAQVAAAIPPAEPDVLLARKYPAVKVDRLPLCRFLDLATSLSAMPVSVAPAELRLAAVSAATPVSVDLQEATIEQMLAAALKPLRLVPQVDESQIVLRRTVGADRRTLTYPVGDLVEGNATELQGWVQVFVAPGTWKVHGGDGELAVEGATLRINNSERVGYETILFLERYRTARGLPPQSKYPAALLAAGSNGAELAQRLAGPATFTFSRPTAVREVFRWWQDELGVAVLVDWPALAEQRLWPQTRVTATATARPWGEAIDSVLEPLGLGWRAVDGTTIEITSREKVEHEPTVEFYRLSAKGAAAADDVHAQAKKIAGADASMVVRAGDPAIVIVRQSAAAQRRLAVFLAGAGFLAGAAD